MNLKIDYLNIWLYYLLFVFVFFVGTHHYLYKMVFFHFPFPSSISLQFAM